jgi:hypothetical protein
MNRSIVFATSFSWWWHTDLNLPSEPALAGFLLSAAIKPAEAGSKEKLLGPETTS